MDSLVQWLEGLGLGQYAAVFAANDIDWNVLHELTEDDLEKLGLSLGHRKRLLKAISAQPADQPKAGPQPVFPALPQTAGHRMTEPERRQLTVMFCDLVGSTALSTSLDLEDFREVISTYYRCVAETMESWDGFVANYMGDGVLVYFGYPEAHEDDVERAVSAGLALVEAVGHLQGPSPLEVRIGIATGMVVVGDHVGAGDAQGHGVVGEALNLAARLQALAEPGTVVVGPTTRRLLGDLFEYQELGAFELKGFSEPVTAYRVTGSSTLERRFEALHKTGLSPLIGRDAEMQILRHRWVQARGGEGHAVLLCGEPGIGKSRIARALEEAVSSDVHVELSFYCSPHRQDSAFFPVIGHFECAAGIARVDAAEQKMAKLQALLERASVQPEETALIAELLSMPVEDHLRQPQLSPQKHREQTLKALLAYVVGLAAQQPVLMVFEDVQWIDPTSLELLGLVIERLPHLPILLLVTARPEFASPWSDLDIRITTLPLPRLSRRSGEALVRQVTAGKSLPSDVQEQILARTDGVPLFIEELTKAMLESGLLVDTGDHYTAAGLVPPLAIPETLHASLLARLDRLAPVREVAQIGAALGRQFSYEMIAAVAAMPRERLDDALEQLVGAGLMHRSGSPPEVQYAFKHPLVQDAAYSTLLRGRRQQMHARIARTLEKRFQDIVQTHPELLAHHYTEAGNLEAAIPAWLLAGRRALERSALAEAVAQFHKGLALLCGMPGDTRRRRQELDLRIALGRALIATQGHASPATGEAYARARELSEELNRPPEFVPVLYGQCVHHLMRAELEVARAHAHEMQRLGEAQNDVRLRLMGCRLTGQPELYLGEFAAAREHLEQGLALFDPSHRPFYADQSLQDARVMLLGFLSQALLCLGYPDQARRQWEEAVMEARQLNQAYTLAVALGMACALEIATDMAWVGRRNFSSAAAPLADELAALSAEQEFPMLCAMGTLYRGWCLTAAGQAGEGLALLEHGLAAYRGAGTSLWTPFFLSIMADAHIKACQPEQGMKYLAEAARVIDDTQERWVEAEVHRLQAELTAGMGDPVAAEACFHRALATAERQDARLWKLRAATGLARLWRIAGRCGEARDFLMPVYNWFTEGFTTPDLKEAKALLDELDAQARDG